MSRRDIEEIIIRPMRQLYLPPRHLRQWNAADPDALEEAIGQYCHALAGYDRDTLARAWQRVRAGHEFSIWPTPATLVQAAELCVPRPRPATELERRRQRAWERAEAYADHFMKRRQVAKLARQEGWAGELRGYVQAAAWVQAQLIEGLERDGVSLPRELLRAGGSRSTREALAAWKEAFAGPVSRGEIDVRLPKAVTAAWKEAAARGENRSADAEPPTAAERLRLRCR